MRPSMCLVFGVDDLMKIGCLDMMERRLYVSDEKIKVDSDLAYLKDMFCTTTGWGTIADYLYVGGRWNPGIAGMIISRCCSDMVRTLSQLHDEYQMCGSKDLPVLDPDRYSNYAKKITSNLPLCGDIEFQWSWFYSATVEMHAMWPVYAYCTQWLFRQAGIGNIDYRRLKAMLVWHWS